MARILPKTLLGRSRIRRPRQPAALVAWGLVAVAAGLSGWRPVVAQSEVLGRMSAVELTPNTPGTPPVQGDPLDAALFGIRLGPRSGARGGCTA